MTTVVVALVAALAFAAVVGWFLTRRSGSIKEVVSDDPGLGARLVKDYHVLPPRNLTSCSTCHR